MTKISNIVSYLHYVKYSDLTNSCLLEFTAFFKHFYRLIFVDNIMQLTVNIVNFEHLKNIMLENAKNSKTKEFVKSEYFT